jgi:hypothetical protein
VTPYTIEHEGRKAVICGNRVQLYRIRQARKKRPQDVSAWPEMAKVDALDAWNTALLWVRHGYIETGVRERSAYAIPRPRPAVRGHVLFAMTAASRAA